MAFPLTRQEVDKLHVLSDPALLVIPGRFTPAEGVQQMARRRGPGAFIIFPDQNVNEKIGAATYKLIYRMYRWDSAAKAYVFTREGSQLCTLDKKPASGVATAKFYPLGGS